MTSRLENSAIIASELAVHPHRANYRSAWRLWGTCAATLSGILLLVIPFESAHWQATFFSDRPLVTWMSDFNADTSLYFLWLFCLPLAWRWRFHLLDPESQHARQIEQWLQGGKYKERKQPAVFPVDRTACLLGTILFCLAFLRTTWIQQELSGLPPAYHDEYSYLFQAETLLQGRVTNDRFEPAPELFDQMHVLNLGEGKFASRYFPGTGIWLSPFLAVGKPYLGYVFAQSLLVLLIFLTTRDLAGNGTGLIAGLLVMLLPGLEVFSQLLLAHHPCLVGLGIFWWMYFRWRISGWCKHALFCSCGLVFAMYCRPLTAFGIGLPFGIDCLLLLWRKDSIAAAWPNLLAMGGPILCGLIALLPYNQAITGSMTVSPYQQYTQNYTPRHVYGFHNRSRGENWISQQAAIGNPLPVIETYDQWADELDSQLAFSNTITRLVASGQWTIGILPTLACLLLFVGLGHADQREWWLVPVALLSLHLLHVPYWYAGIMHWHYVLEGAPLIAMICARCTQLLCWNFRLRSRHWLAVWWGGMIASGLLIGNVPFEPFWPGMLDAGQGQVQYSRSQHAEVNQWLARNTDPQSVIVIQQDASQLHFDFVVNSPPLTGDRLRVRYLPEKYPLAELPVLFPGRKIYLADVKNRRVQELFQNGMQ